MDKGVRLPVNEGPTPQEPAFFRELDSDSNPEIGGLNRENFAQLGDWYEARMADGCGFAYRIGVKEGVRDSEGDLATAMIMFWLPFARGRKPDDAAIKSLENVARRIVTATIVQYSNFYDNLVGMLCSPPKYMIDDLKKDRPYAQFLTSPQHSCPGKSEPGK
jgi:hypothetical protein